MIGLDTSPGRCKAARDAGVEQVIDVSPDKQVQAVLDLTRQDGVSITVDSVGHSAVIQNAIAATAQYGQVVLLGFPRAPVEGNLTDAFNRIHMQSLTVRGALEWRLPRHRTRSARHSVEGNLALGARHHPFQEGQPDAPREPRHRAREARRCLPRNDLQQGRVSRRHRRLALISSTGIGRISSANCGSVSRSSGVGHGSRGGNPSASRTAMNERR